MDDCVLDELEELKKRISDNACVNDNVVCGICDELISAAIPQKDWQSVAYGYVWRADYFFYVASDVKASSRELDFAQNYLDERTPSVLLEKYYTLKHVLYENSYDIPSAFRYSLKALDVAEKLGMSYRVGANYGNIGAYYMEICCYEEALLYTGKAVETLRAQPETRPRTMRLLLSNLAQINLKLGRHAMAEQVLKELSELPIEARDLKIYIDYGYFLYYSAVIDLENSLNRLQAMFEDGLLESPRAFAFEFLSEALEVVLRLEQKERAEELLHLLQGLVEDNEPDAQLSLCRLRIAYVLRFGTPGLLSRCYRDYYTRYIQVQAKANELKAQGLHAKVELNELSIKSNQSQQELRELAKLANFDDLTNIYNRRYLNIRQDEILNCQQNPDMGFAVIDIDYFKEFNDYYGHPAGDQLLRVVAACLEENTTENMEIFRYGGDEFVCLHWNAQPETLKAFVKRVQTAMEEKKIEHIKSRCAEWVTLSIGYGNRPVTGKFDLLSLFEEVDNALYASKNCGRNSSRSIWDMDEVKEGS